MTTDRQIAANRRNAQKSTGPKTDRGKAAVRLNALRHGLLARDIFIDAGEGREDPAEYAALLEGLREYYQPEGALELILVEKILVNYWRMRRAARAEVGVLRRAQDRLQHERREAQEHELRLDLQDLNRDLDTFERAALWEAESAATRPHVQRREMIQRRVRNNPLGIRRLIETLDLGIAELENPGWFSEDTNRRLKAEFFGGEQSLFARLNTVPQAHTPEEEEAQQQTFAEMLRSEREGLESVRREVEQRDGHELETARLIAALPDDGDVTRIQRYEGMYERGFYQAIAQLERLQRRRLGEASLPPISVELTMED